MNSGLIGDEAPSKRPSLAGLNQDSPKGMLFEKLVDHCNGIGRVNLVQEQWRDDPASLDFVCVDTKRMVMEKSRHINRQTGLSGVRIRFWLKELESVVEMHFTPHLECAGWFMPVTLGFDVNSPPYRTETAFVGLAVSVSRNVVVTGEHALSTALSNEEVSKKQANEWREQLRSLRRQFMARRYPPAIVRNFTLAS